MNLPILYKRTKTSAIQQWEVFTEHEDDFSTIIKLAGQLGGKLTTHTETIEQGKNLGKANETTPAQQADSQAQSDWNAKKLEGYKDMIELGLVSSTDFDGTTVVMKERDDSLSEVPLEAWLAAVLPKYNSGAGNVPLPMLAKAVNWDKVKYPCYVQPKLDGVRCLMVVQIDDEETMVKFLSRSGKEYTTLDHIKNDVIRYSFENDSYEDSFILDGEIYADPGILSFQQICAAVKKQQPDSLKLQFRCYDIVNDKPQLDRLQDCIDLTCRIESPYIHFVNTQSVHTKEAVLDLHDAWVKEGYEGAMVRFKDGTYDQGQRSSSLLKVKEFDEAEFEFDGWEQGQRNEDLIAVCTTIIGTQFKAKMVGTREEKKAMTRANQVPAMMTIKHFGWTDGEKPVPRFPIGKGFRLPQDQ